MLDLPEERQIMRALPHEYPTQLRMVWPEHLLDAPPAMELPSGYYLRQYQPGDEPRFFRVMELAGWDGEKLQPWQEHTFGGFAASVAAAGPAC